MSSPSPVPVNIGLRVISSGKVGTVRFIGLTQFSPGQWIGIELDHPTGKNDGSVQGIRYFDCVANEGKPNELHDLYGLFVRPNTVKHLPESRRVSSSSHSRLSLSSPRKVCNRNFSNSFFQLLKYNYIYILTMVKSP